MDRKGLTESIESKDALIQCFQWNIRECEKQKADLEAQLAEAENTGLRFVVPKHLDYGPYHYGDHPPVMAVYINMSCGLRDLALFVRTKGWAEYARNALKNGGFTAIRGSLVDVFDHLKELAKPLKHFRADVHEYEFNVAKPDFPIMVAGNWHTLSNAKEISTDLQRLIQTYEQTLLKQK